MKIKYAEPIIDISLFDAQYTIVTTSQIAATAYEQALGVANAWKEAGTVADVLSIKF